MPLSPLPPHSPQPGEGNVVGAFLPFSLFSRSGGVRWEKRAGVMRGPYFTHTVLMFTNSRIPTSESSRP